MKLIDPCGGYRLAETPSDLDGKIAYARIGAGLPILGVIRDLLSPQGVQIPSFSVSAQGHAMPIVYAIAGEGKLSITVSDIPRSEYIDDPVSQHLAAVYAQYCDKFGLTLDESCTLNVVYYLGTAGIRHVCNENLQQAADIIGSVRQAFYKYIELIELRPEELANPPKLQ